MIFETVKKIIIQHLFIEDKIINLETKLREDLNLDSFDAVQLVMKLEEKFNLKISDEIMHKFKNIKDIVDYIVQNTPQHS